MNPYIIPVVSPIISLLLLIFGYAFLAKSRDAATAAKIVVDADAKSAKILILDDEARARAIVQSELGQWKMSQSIIDENHAVALIHSELAKLEATSASDNDARIRLIFQSELAKWQVGFQVSLNGTYLRGGEAAIRFAVIEKTLERIERLIQARQAA